MKHRNGSCCMYCIQCTFGDVSYCCIVVQKSKLVSDPRVRVSSIQYWGKSRVWKENGGRVGWMEREKVREGTEVWEKEKTIRRERRERKIWRVHWREWERKREGERVRGWCVERGVWEKSICSLKRLEETISPVWPSSPLGVSTCVLVHVCVYLCIYLMHLMPEFVCK